MEFEPVRSSSLQDAIYQQLLDAITSGRLHPGERLALEVVAAQFDVSIMPVREAFRKLEATKLVTREKNRSLTVSKLSLDNLREIMTLRLLLEPYAGEIAAQIADKETIQSLEDMHEKMEAVTDIDSYLKLNQKFHYTIYRASELTILMEIIESLWQRFSPYLYILLRNEKEHPYRDYVQNHEGMIEGLKRRDRKMVRKWVTTDLSEAKERITVNFGQIEMNMRDARDAS